MRKIILSVVLTLSLSLWANDPGAKDYKSMGESSRPDERGSIGFAIEENREGLVYGLGEEAVFTVTATNGTGGKVSSGKLKVTVSDYTFRPAQTREVDLSRENPFVLRGTMTEPGFLRFEIEGEGVPKTVRGAAFAPERIRAAGTCPRDFDAFWSEAKAKLAREVPLDPRLVHVPERSTDTFDFWRVSFATFGGQRVWGFLTVPKDKSKAPFPVRFSISSAGTGRWTWDFESARHQDEVINMSFTVHRFEPPTNQADADRLHKQLAEELKAECGVGSYPVAGFGKSREDAYFYRPILGIDRAVDWLWSRPDVDRRSFIYRGGSQGGGLGMTLLGLNHRFTAALLHVPAMMDMLGSEVGRECGFPYLKGYYGNRADRDAAFANAAYYNGAFFASRVTCPVRVSMGFIDDICPPTGVYAAYNELRVKDRQILHGLYRAHGWWPEAEVFEKWLLSLGALAAGIGAGQYDPLMAEKSAIVDTNGVKWIDGRHLPLEGKAFSDVDRFYDRLPSGVTTNVNGGVRSMKSHTAGMQFRFRTTSPFVSFVWCPIGRDLAMTHMPATGMSGIDFTTASRILRSASTGTQRSRRSVRGRAASTSPSSSTRPR